MTIQFQTVQQISKKEAIAAFESGCSNEICTALIAITFHDADWRWVQDYCLEFLAYSDPDVSGLAATCLGHLARIHGEIDLDRVVPALHRRLTEESIAGRIEDAIDDIESFARPK